MGSLGDHTRPPGLRQGTTVCVHTRMDMEQPSDHKPMTRSGMVFLVVGQGRTLLSPWCARRNVPTGLNLNQYAGPGSFSRWHSDNEPLFGPQCSPKLIISLSLRNSVEFMVRRRAPGEVPSSIRLDHGDILVVDGLAQSEYEHCTASGLQGPRVIWSAPGFTLGGGNVTVGVHPAWRCTSPLAVVPIGSGDGVGDCHDVANLPKECLFISLLYFLLEKSMLFLQGYGLLFLCTAEYASSQEGAHTMLQ